MATKADNFFKFFTGQPSKKAKKDDPSLPHFANQKLRTSADLEAEDRALEKEENEDEEYVADLTTADLSALIDKKIAAAMQTALKPVQGQLKEMGAGLSTKEWGSIRNSAAQTAVTLKEIATHFDGVLTGLDRSVAALQKDVGTLQGGNASHKSYSSPNNNPANWPHFSQFLAYDK